MVAQPLFNLIRSPAQGRVVVGINAVRHHLGAVIAHPDKIVAGQLHLPGRRTHEQIGIISCLFEQLRKTPVVAKRIEADRRGIYRAELLLKIGPAQLHLADDRFAGRHVAVGLQIPAAHDVPLARRDQLLNPLKQLRLILLHPAIEQRLIVTEYKIVKFLAEVRRCAER